MWTYKEFFPGKMQAWNQDLITTDPVTSCLDFESGLWHVSQGSGPALLAVATQDEI